MSEAEASPKEGVPSSRRRNLLREFYGIQQSPTAEKEVVDTTNINSQHFDATKYYEDLLKSNNLASLIQIDNNMIAGTFFLNFFLVMCIKKFKLTLQKK